MAGLNCLRNNKTFLRYLYESNPRKRRQLLEIASPDEIKSLCECAFIILHKNVALTPEQDAQLRKPRTKKLMYQLVNKRISIEHKRDLAVQAGGGFPFTLLTPVIDNVMGAVSEF
jgi:hypothetical protein